MRKKSNDTFVTPFFYDRRGGVENFFKKVYYIHKFLMRTKMLGAIAGDVIGSCYEFHNIKTKSFPLFSDKSTFTDDTILTCATVEWLLSKEDAKKIFSKWGRFYQSRTLEEGKIPAFGKGFMRWIETGEPYNARTNGCVMRISPIGLYEKDFETALKKALYLTNMTHNHHESLKYTVIYIETMFLMKQAKSSNFIRRHISKKYEVDLSKSIDEIRPSYNKFYCSCKNSVPQAITAALEASSFEDAIRNAVSLGGDSDTLAAMAGGLAEVKFQIPQKIKKKTLSCLDDNIKRMIFEFYQKIR